MKFLILFLLVLSTVARAAEFAACSPKQGPPCFDTRTQLTLIGGEIADPNAWPNSLITRNCSITVVGERVAVHAAHCVSNGGTVTFAKGGSRYTAKCEHHPSYRGNSTADWALCKTSESVEGGEYEVLNNDKSRLKMGEKLMLSGYGCTKWGGGGFGKLRIGEAPITRLPSGTNYDIVTRGNVALCSGDSGGASFLMMPGGVRYLVGVNSRSNTTTTSYMPSWAEPSAMKWGMDWANRNGVKICGYHADAVGCRMALPPPPPSKVEFENAVAKSMVELKPGHEAKLETAKGLLTELMGKLLSR
jgi:hypothetical protein